MDFLIGTSETNINQYIVNKPQITVSSRDEFNYFVFVGSSVVLELLDNATTRALLVDKEFLKIQKGADVVWSGYLNLKTLIEDAKKATFRITFEPEHFVIKDISFSRSITEHMNDLLDALVAQINTVYSGYTWEGEHIETNNVMWLKGLFRIYDPLTQTYSPNGFYSNVGDFYLDGTGSNLYVYDAPNNIYRRIGGDEFLDSTPTISGQQTATKTLQSIPIFGDKWVVDFTYSGYSKPYKYFFVYDAVNGYYWPWGYGDFWTYSQHNPQYSGSNVGEVLSDVVKLSDSLLFILNKKLQFVNNLSTNEYDLSSIVVIEKRKSSKIIDSISEVTLAMDMTDTNIAGAKYKLDNAYYPKKIEGSYNIYEFTIYYSGVLLPGYKFKIDGVDYGRITNVTYTKNDNIIKVTTEKSEYD